MESRAGNEGVTSLFPSRLYSGPSPAFHHPVGHCPFAEAEAGLKQRAGPGLSMDRELGSSRMGKGSLQLHSPGSQGCKSAQPAR